MDSAEFKHFRKKLDKTQKQMAQLLGVSIKAIHSYEQGWRSIPVHIERQVLLLIYLLFSDRNGQKVCWEIKDCPQSRMKECPAWEFQAGKMCWLINGTICEGKIQKNWKEKMDMCRSCEVFVHQVLSDTEKTE